MKVKNWEGTRKNYRPKMSGGRTQGTTRKKNAVAPSKENRFGERKDLESTGVTFLKGLVRIWKRVLRREETQKGALISKE